MFFAFKKCNFNIRMFLPFSNHQKKKNLGVYSFKGLRLTQIIKGCGYGTASGATEAAEQRGISTRALNSNQFDAIGSVLADATLVVLPRASLSRSLAERVEMLIAACPSPTLTICLGAAMHANSKFIQQWLRDLQFAHSLHIVGPLEIEAPGTHQAVQQLVAKMLDSQDTSMQSAS